MTAGLTISAFMPSITSSSIFSTRRANNGVKASNPLVGIMNFDIAAGQVLNAAKGVANIAKESRNSLANGIVSAEESIKNMAKGDKVAGCFGKALTFTADHINPVICATSAVKVMCAEDKKEAALSEGLALGTMFGCERAAKSIIGIPKIKKYDNEKMVVKEDGLYQKSKQGEKLIAKDGMYKIIDNEKVVINRNALYKKSDFLAKQAGAIKDYCDTKTICSKPLKFTPGALKGLGFALASIGGYAFGSAAAELITGENKKQA